MADVPKFERKTAFRVTRSPTNMLAPAAAITVMDFNTIVYDVGSNFNLTTDTYVAPLNGIYSMQANWVAFVQAAGDSRALISLYVNGAEHSRGTDHQRRGTLINDRWSYAVSAELHLNEGDLVTARIQNVTGAQLQGLDGPQFIYFSGHRIQTESRTILGG